MLKIASVPSPEKVITWHHRIARETPERSAWGKLLAIISSATKMASRTGSSRRDSWWRSMRSNEALDWLTSSSTRHILEMMQARLVRCAAQYFAAVDETLRISWVAMILVLNSETKSSM